MDSMDKAATKRGPAIVRIFAIAWIFCGAFLFSLPALAQDPAAREIVDRVETLLWGKTVQGEYEMTIATPRWQRTLELRAWMDRPKRSFVRILAPAKEKGIGSLRIGAEMWNYLARHGLRLSQYADSQR